MRNIWTIARREYKYYFVSPVAYLVAFGFLLIIGVYFYLVIRYVAQSFGQVSPPGIQIITDLLSLLLVFICPALTMRLVSEEQRTGTIELLLTAPIRDWEVIVGKWLGSFLFLLTIILITWIYPFVLNSLVSPGIDQGPLITGYLGIILISAAFLGIGVAVSSLFNNQIASLITTIGILIIAWFLLNIAAQVVSPGGGGLLGYLDIRSHFSNSLLNGVIELSDVVYYLSVTAFTLFLGSVLLEVRRWR